MNCVSTWRNTAHAHVGSQCSKFASFGENSRESCALLAIPHDSNKSEPRKPDPCDPAEHAETLSLGGIKARGRKRMSALHGSTQLVNPPAVHRSRLPGAHDSPGRSLRQRSLRPCARIACARVTCALLHAQPCTSPPTATATQDPHARRTRRITQGKDAEVDASVKEETSAAAAIEKLNTKVLHSIENMICGGSAAKGDRCGP